MALKRQKRNNDTDTGTDRAAKKQKLNEEHDSIMANLDLDLNIVVGVGKEKRPISLNFYSDKMQEIQIDPHIYFQFNPGNYAHNILWKNKVILDTFEYSKYHDLITQKNAKYCHFHQPSPKQMLEMYEMAPSSLQESESCGTILYNIHKSVMGTLSDHSYRRRNREELQKELINLDIPNIANNKKLFDRLTHKIPTQSYNDSKTNEFLEIDTSAKHENEDGNTVLLPDVIDDYGFTDNVFHKLAVKYSITPTLLIKLFLRFKFEVTPDTAKRICILLANQPIQSNMSLLKDKLLKLYNITISIGILNAVFFGVMTDCVHGYNAQIAWFGWNKKIMASRNQILIDVFQKCLGKGAQYLEHTLVGKLRAMIAKINGKIKNKKDKIRILNEEEQRMKIDALKREKVKFYRKRNGGGLDSDGEEKSDYTILMEIGWIRPPTPDLLFNRPVMINGRFINWMDSKNFLMTYKDTFKHKSVKWQVSRYNKAFGAGAIVCLGFVEYYKKFQKQVMLLDASYWTLTSF